MNNETTPPDVEVRGLMCLLPAPNAAKAPRAAPLETALPLWADDPIPAIDIPYFAARRIIP